MSSQSILKPSVLVILFSFCFSIFTMDIWRSWHGYEENFRWDVAQYYSYLPAKFCNNNSFAFKKGFDGYLPFSPKGERMPKMTYGMSVLYAPFFAVGYKVAINQNSPLDGFSEPFATCVHWGSIFYGLLGLLLLRNFLIKFFDEKVTALTLVICFFGTNLFYYILGESEMTHGYLFTLISGFLLLTWHWYQKPTWPKTMGIGAILGLISLIRPTDFFVVLIFLLWNVTSIAQLKERIQLFWNFKWHLITMSLLTLAWWTPQFIFWKEMTGQYFYFSYAGEKFFWTDPQVINVLFSYRKGWVLYTPLTLLIFTGFFFMREDVKKLRPVLLILLILNVYVLSCWWTWFYGGSFGARCFVSHYAFLSLPIAAICKFFLSSPSVNKWIASLRIAFFIIVFSGLSLNIQQSFQYSRQYIHWADMSKEAYWYVFGKSHLYPEEKEALKKMLKPADDAKMRSGENRDQ